MRYIAAVLVGALFFASPSHAEPPCDFKGISVGTRMTPDQIMTALGVSTYKMNPVRSSFEERLLLSRKYRDKYLPLSSKTGKLGRIATRPHALFPTATP